MAVHSPDRVSYYLSLPVEHRDFLGSIRHWTDVKIAFDEDLVWIKDLNLVQAESVAVKSIPYIKTYYASGDHLFLKGSRLPDRRVPSLLWSPVQRGLPLQLPSLNHNYFGLSSKAEVKILPSSEEKESFALLASLKELGDYIIDAPAIRSKNLTWTVMNEQALILGTPLLPVQGEVFWKQGDFLLPAGFDLELTVIGDALNELINPGKDAWILWNKESEYYRIEKKWLYPLSVASWRLTGKNKP